MKITKIEGPGIIPLATDTIRWNPPAVIQPGLKQSVEL